MAQLFRPSEIVLDILTEGQKGAFTKEDSEKVIDETEKRGSGLSNLPTSEYRTPVYTMWASALRSKLFFGLTYDSLVPTADIVNAE